MAERVDLNADLGELPGAAGEQIDDDLLAVVSSASVACGGHAGDGDSMRRVARIASQRGVAVGAHISYPDRENFGRREVSLSARSLMESLRGQVEALFEATTQAGTSVRYIKAHGALYNAAVADDGPAAILVGLAQEFSLPVLTQSHGRLALAAQAAGVVVAAEFFADRAYESNGRLRPRDQPRAVIAEPSQVVGRVVSAVRERTVTSHDGLPVTVAVDSICLHGDTPAATRLARAVRSALEQERIVVLPFAHASL